MDRASRGVDVPGDSSQPEGKWGQPKGERGHPADAGGHRMVHGQAQSAASKGPLVTWAVLLVTLLVLLPSCTSRGRQRPLPVRGGPDSSGAYRGPAGGNAAGRAPDWATQPHSWGKLDAIERWLGSSTPAARDETSYWHIEGQLQIAEGQLRFAQEAQEQRRRTGSAAAENLVAYRRDSAIARFQTVRESSTATGDQQTRARRGLQSARSLQGTNAGTSEASAPTVPIGGLVPRASWSASRADQGNMRRATGTWRWITVHHSVFAPSTGQLSDSLDVVRRIQRQHIDVENYADIGYHFLIDREGRVIEGRRLIWQGAHAGDSNKNRGNVGICLLGNFETEHPSKKALASLDRLVLELQRKLRIPRPNVRPHSAWKETACPGRHLMPWFTRRR